MDKDLFSIYWEDPQGNTHTECVFQPLDTLGDTWKRLTSGPAAKLGIVRRAILVDALDCIALEYTYERRMQYLNNGN